jgi:hypothetical protein
MLYVVSSGCPELESSGCPELESENVAAQVYSGKPGSTCRYRASAIIEELLIRSLSGSLAVVYHLQLQSRQKSAAVGLQEGLFAVQSFFLLKGLCWSH